MIVLGAILVASVASHLVVSLEVLVLASHPGFGLVSLVVSVKFLGVNTGDTLKQRRLSHSLQNEKNETTESD